MTGNALAQRLRHLEGGRKMRLIAVTGYGQEQDRIASRESGFDRHLVKPVDALELVALLAEPAASEG